MRPYEVVVIFDAGLEDDVIRAAIDRFTEAVRARGGNPGRVDHWGKRRFAYEMRHRWEGYYALLEIDAEPPAMAELDRVLSLADEVIRHKVVRVPDQVAGRAGRGPAAAAAPAPASPAEPAPVGATPPAANPDANGA